LLLISPAINDIGSISLDRNQEFVEMKENAADSTSKRFEEFMRQSVADSNKSRISCF
jgi:hypothetical protein